MFSLVCSNFFQSSWNNTVDKYLSPVSGSSTTITFPLFSGLFAICVAAKTAAPEDIPTKSPSVLHGIANSVFYA